jgi:hypothetical protein
MPPSPMSYNNIVPLGKCTVTTAGTPIPLSQNCGPLAGTVQSTTTQIAPATPGRAVQQFTLQASSNNTGNLYLMPRNKTVTANPDQILAILPPGSSIPFPVASAGGPGLLPENFAFDTDTNGTQVFYGYGVLR